MTKRNQKFSKLPLTESQKKQRSKELINAASYTTNTSAKGNAVLLRIPPAIMADIQHISQTTGLNRTAVCIDLLRQAAKQKLKDLQKEDTR